MMLASMIQRFSSSPRDVDGFVLGHVTQNTPSTLSDDTSSADSHLVDTITGFICFGISLSFYESLGGVDSLKLPVTITLSPGSRAVATLLSAPHSAYSQSPVPSTIPQFHFTVRTEIPSLIVTPCIFILLTSPQSDQLIHMHQYRAYTFNNFMTNSVVPFMNCSSAAIDEESAGAKKEKMSDQKY